MHVFLTGATGFIGGNLLKGLLDVGHTVTAVVRPDTPRKAFLPDESQRLRYVLGDFYDNRLLKTISGRFDVLIHTAAIRGAGKGERDLYEAVNVEGTRALTEFALKNEIPRFLYLSTVGVLGTIPEHLPAQAQDPPRPDNTYHRSKWEAEKIVHAIPEHALNTLILRPTITYGTNDNGFIPRLMAFVKKKRLILPSEPVRIHLLYVGSLVRLINQILALDLFNNGTYLVADREAVLLQTIADLARGFVGGGYRQLPRFFFDAGDMLFSLLGRADLRTAIQLISQSWYYDITPLQKDFLYEPVDTLETIPEIMAAFQEAGESYRA